MLPQTDLQGHRIDQGRRSGFLAVFERLAIGGRGPLEPGLRRAGRLGGQHPRPAPSAPPAHEQGETQEPIHGMASDPLAVNPDHGLGDEVR